MIFGWILIICGASTMIINALIALFMGSTMSFSYQDIDGEYITMTIDSNTIWTTCIIKYTLGVLVLWQGKAINKVFKPIMKEYKNAETGVTQGILMNERKSKKMVALKKKIYKVTLITSIVAFFSIIYCKNVQDELIEQWMDQKYEYIQNNSNVNETYNVDQMQEKAFNKLHNKTFDMPREKEEGPKPRHIDFRPHPPMNIPENKR